MSMVVYWLQRGQDRDDGGFRKFGDTELTLALDFASERRKEGCMNVVISTEPANCVGEPGVDSIKDGRTPDGHLYEWSKTHRGAGPGQS